jgi:hypothetical protein
MNSQTIEISIYILIAAAMFVYRTVLSGRKNGCFYHKNDEPLPLMLDREIRNIHFLETPAWYSQSMGVFLILLALSRGLNYSLEFWTIIAQLGICSLITLGTVQAASYHFQRGITAGTKDDDHLDKINDTEVAIVLFGKKIQFWRGRLFSNRRRKLAQWLGIIEILSGTALLIIYNIFRLWN